MNNTFLSHSKPDDAHRPAAENPRKCSKDQEGIGVLRESERASKQQTGQRGAEGSPQPRLGGRRCRDVRACAECPQGCVGVAGEPEGVRGFPNNRLAFSDPKAVCKSQRPWIIQIRTKGNI